MTVTVLDPVPYTLDFDTVVKHLHLESLTDQHQQLKELVTTMEAIARPKGMYRVAFIEDRGDDWVQIDQTRFNSRVLAVNLAEVHRVFPFVATCGEEVESWCESLDDVLMQYWAGGVREVILRQAINNTRDHMLQRFEPGPIAVMNPGSLPDWPIESQEHLFSLLGQVKETIGVALTPSYLMQPLKSVSGLWFTNETGYQNCKLCPREDCAGRRSEYDPHLWEEKYQHC